MRIRHTGILGIVLLATAAAAIQIHAAASVDGQQYAGTWNGNWEGAGGSGRFDLTIQVGSDGNLAGGVSVGTDQGDYTAKFSKIDFAGNKMTGTYDYPLDAQGEVSITGTFDAKGASGTWGLGAKGQSGGQTVAEGTWKTEKK